MEWAGRFFATGHFYSGNVRYIGYVIANPVAIMYNDYLLDQLESSTGRRTLVNQPQLATLWKKGYGAAPAGLPLDQAIRKLTGGRTLQDAIDSYFGNAEQSIGAFKVKPVLCASEFDPKNNVDPFLGNNPKK